MKILNLKPSIIAVAIKVIIIFSPCYEILAAGMSSDQMNLVMLDSVHCFACGESIGPIEMPENGEITFWASEFTTSQSDSCGDIEYRIWYSAMDSSHYPDHSQDWERPKSTSSAQDILNKLPSAAIIYCAVMNEMLEKDFDVIIYGVSKTGSWYECGSTILMTDPEFVCRIDTNFHIGGNVSNCMGKPIRKVIVTLFGGINNQEFRDQMVDANGDYRFTVAAGYNWGVHAKKPDHLLNGVTAQDLSLLIRHISGISIIQNPYKKLACDVNGDLNIDIRDFIMMRKLLLGIIDDFEEVPKWRFIDANYNFIGITDYSIPISVIDAQWIYFIPLRESQLETNFIGVKMGDLNGDANLD